MQTIFPLPRLVQDYAAILKRHSVRPDLFDELVHEVYSAKAADINNAGFEAQMEFLMAEGLKKEIEDLIDLELDEKRREKLCQ